MNELMKVLNNDRCIKQQSTELKYSIPAHPMALQFCWHIRVGMYRDIDPQKIKAYADFFYRNYLDLHLCAQEKLIMNYPGIPALVIKKIMSSQRRLRRLFEESRAVYKSFSQIEDTLEQHVRLEQRVLFKEFLSVFSHNGEDTTKLDRLFYDPSLGEKLKTWKDKYWSLY
jgi:hypothetical protein